MNIYDIAKKAGVSSATVSRVINGSDKVSIKTAEKVRKIMDELSFTPNVFARSLQSNSLRILGVLTIDISDIYFASAIQTIEQHARVNGYDVQVSFSGTNLEEKIKRIKMLVEKRVDGIILVGSSFFDKDNSHIIEAAQSVPVVIMNGDISSEGVYSIICEDNKGIISAVNYLVENGKRNIVYVYDTNNMAGVNKLNGYRSAMSDHTLPIHIFRTTRGPEGGREVIEKLISKNILFDAIICSEDLLAVGIIKRLRKYNINVPKDVAVTGYDNLVIARSSTPELTSVDGKVETISMTATKMLIDVLEGKEVPKKVIFTPELVIRQST